jgi:hypothetical protein
MGLKLFPGGTLGGDHGQALAEGLGYYVAEILAKTGQDKQARAPEENPLVLAVLGTQETHTILKAQMGGHRFEGRSVPIGIGPREHQLPVIWDGQAGPSPQQQICALLWMETGEEQDDGFRIRGRPGEGRKVEAVGDHCDRGPEAESPELRSLCLRGGME